MPVTITTASHASREWKSSNPSRSIGALFKNSESVIQSSISKTLLAEKHVSPSRNGFVWAAYHAYSGHHHLTVRPEDIWFAILSQLSFYINANAEELREYFVAHEGRKELWVTDVGNIHSVDFGLLAQRMTHLIQENVKDPSLRKWIMPSWSTTTEDDLTTAAVLMMGSLQKYFSYGMGLRCGIPSVTLLGEKADWEDILKRLDKLPELGKEPTTFAELLRPILRHFIASFDPEPSPAVKEFWSKIADKSGGSGLHYLSGWITAFCFWDENGKSLYGDGPKGPRAWPPVGCELDDVLYHKVDTKKIPSGYVSVPVLVDDNGTPYYTKMVAGSLGIQVTSSGNMMEDGYGHGGGEIYRYGEYVPVEYVPPEPTKPPGLDSVQPLSGWLMYEVKEKGDEDAEQFPKFLRRRG